MSTKDTTVKITEEFESDGQLKKTLKEYLPGKTRLDKFSSISQAVGALATPLTIIIAIIGLLVGASQFNAQQMADQKKTLAQNQADLQQQQAQFTNLQDQQHQTTLDTYIDRMSDLLINQHLATSTPNDEVRVIATARTLVTLRNVDKNRRGTIIGFLWEAKLINGPNPIISLNTAYLGFANINSTYLNGVNLSGAIVSFADLNNCDLDGAILTNASLNKVDFRNTTLRNANLKGADLTGAIFNANTDLTGAIMPDGSTHP